MTVLTAPEAAVAIVRARESDSFLLMRRSEHPLDPWSGHWSFPGGRRETRDADLLNTALRELHEECGIQLSSTSLAAELPAVVARRRTPPYTVVAPFVFSVANELPTVLDPEEAVEAVWVSMQHWRSPERHLLRSVPGMSENLLVPSFDLNGVPVWGFTYRLVMNWLGLPSNDGPQQSQGLRAAETVLEFLAAIGVTVKSDWQTVAPLGSAARARLRATAKIDGAIPVAQAVAFFSKPSQNFPVVNAIEIQPNYVCVVGLEFEEYLITTS
jgi:8-oxo-dGTP pyrophosphatase MutT (NUDIX family)